MKVTYDHVSNRVIVMFRGRIVVLPDRYETEAAGIAAAESHCRKLGWRPQDSNGKHRQIRCLW